ncbi:MAG: hypothetical protein ACRY3E_06650 [Candidatus Lariskella arthropodorum]
MYFTYLYVDETNMLMEDGKLFSIIDFCGDPACDLVIAWTYLSGNSLEIFIVPLWEKDPALAVHRFNI